MFDVAVSANTRASSELMHPDDVDIAVQGYSLPEGMRWLSDSDAAALEMEGVRAVHAEGGLWKPENGQTWPGRGRTMTVFAYSPYGRGEFGDDGAVVFRGYSLSEGLDLLFCEAHDRSYNALGRINLAFSRALCLIGFNVVSALDVDKKLTVRKLTLSGLCCCGDFRSLPQPSWEVDGAPRDFVFYEGETAVGEELEALGDEIYMIPQNARIGVELVVDVADGGSVQEGVTLAAETEVAWGVGRLCTYTLKITHDMQLVVEKASAHA